MSQKIRLRRDNTTNWNTYNPILTEGELGVELNASRIKIGNGSTAWNTLEYWVVDGLDSGGAFEGLTGIAAMELETHNQINDYRATKGLPPLQFESNFADIARVHSNNMADGSVPFGHDGSTDRYAQMQTYYTLIALAENVAFNQGHSDPVTIAVQGWIDSPGHEANMTGDYDLTGIGIAENSSGEVYFTHLFGKQN